MMSSKIVTTGTIIYALFGFFSGLALAWFLGWISIPYLRTMAATGWVFIIYGGFVLLFGLWAVSLVPQMKTGLRAMPLATYLWALELGMVLVVLTGLLMGLSSLGF